MKIKKRIAGFWGVVFSLLLPALVYAAFTNEVKLPAPGINAVSISGNTVIMGNQLSGDNGVKAGAINIYSQDTAGSWSMQTLLASDGVANDQFGNAVAVNGDFAIVGAHYNEDNGLYAGKAYTFSRDSTTGVWVEQQKLQASDAAQYQAFGRSVSISGNTLIVGASGDRENGIASGAAYIFTYDTSTGLWTEQQKLTASDALDRQQFGSAVSIDGDTLIIGAGGSASNMGAVYIFEYDSITGVWQEQQKLLATDGVSGDLFGLVASISGNTAIVGTKKLNGFALIFERDPATGVWAQQAKLVTPTASSGDYFGAYVAISGKVAVVGAFYDSEIDTNAGAAYAYVQDSTTGNWIAQKLLASDGIARNLFGGGVAVSGNTIVISSPYNIINTIKGAAYVYTESGGSIVEPDISVADSVAPVTDHIIGFGNVAELAFADQTVTVTNDGNADLTLGNIGVANTLVEPFSITADNCSTQVLTPAANCTLTVRFSPASTGGFINSFDIPSDDPNENPVTVSVNGTGTGMPVADITVTDNVLPAGDLSINYGSVSLASIQEKQVTITNDGNGDLQLGSIAALDILTAPFSIVNDSCSSQTVTPTASCSITVRFEPTDAGEFSDSFDIPSNDADEASVTFNLAGIGVIPLIPDITVSDSVLPADDQRILFGDVLQETVSDETLTITNNGTANLLIGSIASSNPLAAPFSIVSDSCSDKILAVAASCSLSIRFAPTQVSTFNDSFEIPSDDVDENPVIINLSGSGMPILVPEIEVSSQLAFGRVTELTFTEKTLIISNNGTLELNIGNIAQDNTLDAPFSIVSDNCSVSTLQASESCSLVIRFEPESVEVFTDSFNIPSDDADEAIVSVDVSGTGVTQVSSSGKDGFFGIGSFNPWLLFSLLVLFGSRRFNPHLK